MYFKNEYMETSQNFKTGTWKKKNTISENRQCSKPQTIFFKPI